MEEKQGIVSGWVLPDNPKAIPSVKILKPDGSTVDLEANKQRTDLRDRGAHETGMVGFTISKQTHPDVMEVIDHVEVRESQTNALIFRRSRPDVHIEKKLFRFELRAMPDPQLEGLFAKRFTYAYGAVQRYPQDTFFGIFNNPVAKSIYLSGCPNYQQYENLLRQRGYKIIALVRNPYEEMAERLLFARYASGANLPPFVADHIFGLEPLIEMVKGVDFGDTASLRAAFEASSPRQREILTSPLVRTLACGADQKPKMAHVAMALSKLSHMDLVGVRSRFADFKADLKEIVGADVLENHELTSLDWVQRVAEQLPHIKQAKNLISLDLELYLYVEEAIGEALGPASTSQNVA